MHNLHIFRQELKVQLLQSFLSHQIVLEYPYDLMAYPYNFRMNNQRNMYPLPENTESCLLVFHHGFQKSPGIFRFLLLQDPAYLCRNI